MGKRRNSSHKRRKRAPTPWNEAIRSAMQKLKKEGWEGAPTDRMRKAAQMAHKMLGN